MTYLDRIPIGNFGSSKALGGGLHEIRIHYGAGYRVYYIKVNGKVIILLCGGDKGSQKQDIKKARQYWKEVQEEQKKQGGKGGPYKKL